MTENEPVFGRPVTGKITRGSERPDQADPQLLLDELDKVLARPDVAGFRWQQYTQYWNDGEPTEFEVHEYGLAVLPTWSEDYLTLEDELPGTYSTNAGVSWRDRYDYIVDGHDTRELSDSLDGLVAALTSGAHYTFLLKAFGDHAEVTATAEGFNVSFYDHD